MITGSNYATKVFIDHHFHPENIEYDEMLYGLDVCWILREYETLQELIDDEPKFKKEIEDELTRLSLKNSSRKK